MPDAREHNPVSALLGLRDELDALHHQMAAATRRASRPVAGADDSGTVRIHLDPSGHLDHVELAAGWRGAVGAERLAAAVTQAWQNATLARLAAFDGAYAHQDDADAEQRAAPDRPSDVPPRPSALPDGFGPGDPLGHQGSLAALVSLLAEAETALDRYEETMGQAVQELVQGHDLHQQVTVSLRGDTLVAVEVEPHWLHRASPAALGNAIRDAVHQAQERQQRRTAALRPSVFDELRQVAGDPLTLLTTIGLVGGSPDRGDG